MPASADGVSPLAEIERAVLARARDEDLDAGDERAVQRLRDMLHEEAVTWDEQAELGRRPYELASRDDVVERGLRNLIGAGPLESLLDDDDVWEVMINAPDQIFIKRHEGVSGYHDENFHDGAHLLRTLTRLLDRSTSGQRKLDPSEGLQDAQLDDGARLHIVHTDIGRNGNMLVNIRKFTGVAFRSLDELTDIGMMSPAVAAFLRAAVSTQQSIVFAGRPGSGKTTLLSCCAAELDPALRIVTAEEVFEVDIPLPNVAAMQTRPARPDRPAIELRQLVAGFLRMAPDVAVVGEVRDREALPLLLTLSSGVTGYATLHAASARQALTRLRFICQLADTRSELPMSALNALVAESIDVVVFCDRVDGTPVVDHVIAVEDLQTEQSSPTFTVTDLFARGSERIAQWTGMVPSRLAHKMSARGIDVRMLLDGSDRHAS
ncbi:MAG: ATPase, T2SS/T4P/T4SS family [Nitriliruptoraceae bacterium]